MNADSNGPMRFAEVVKLLGSPFPAQAAFLADIPETATDEGFSKFNPVHRMAVLYLESTSVCEGDGGSEGEESWLARTGFPQDLVANRDHELWQLLRWLSFALSMLMKLDKPYLFTKQGLRSATEWKLVRHLASDVCRTMDWPLVLRYPDFESLWHDLGGEVIDEGAW
jgi:hypothetical protein